MFSQIINKAAGKKNWNLSQYGFSFDCSDFNEETQDLFFDFLYLHDLNPTIQSISNENGTSLHIILSPENFNAFQKGLEIYGTGKNLLEDGIAYDPLSDEDISLIKRHIILKTDKESSDQNQEQQKDDFFEYLLNQTKYSVLANRLLNEFCFICQNHEQTNRPLQLKIDISQSAIPTLDKKQASGMAGVKDHQPFIMVKNYDNQINVETFFHELRHVIQTGHHLFRDKETDGVFHMLNALAREAEAKSYDLIIQTPKQEFVSSISRQEIQQIALKVIKDPSLISYNPNLIKEEKIGATLRDIQIEAHESTLELLCQLHLQASRTKIYNLLKKNHIHLLPKSFKELSEHIEYWKSYYYPKLMCKNPQPQLTIQTQKEATQKLEEEWREKTGLRLSLSPTHIFSSEISKTLGIISPQLDESTAALVQPVYKLPEDVSKQVHQLYKKNQFNEIIKIYNHIQEENPFLPKEIQASNIQSQARYYTIVIDKMQRGDSFKNILSLFGYYLNDPKPVIKTIANPKVNQGVNQRN